MNKNVGTVCVHGKKQRRNADNTGAVSFPIYQSATFVHPAFGESTGFDYSRLQNPTREELERVVNDLEEGVDALAFSTGMAAVTALLDILEPGDHIVATDDLYGGTIRLMESICKKNGIKTTFVETDKVENVENKDEEAKSESKATNVKLPTSAANNQVVENSKENKLPNTGMNTTSTTALGLSLIALVGLAVRRKLSK